MNLLDFLANAGFWNWVGVCYLASMAACAIAGFGLGLGKIRVFTIEHKIVNNYAASKPEGK